MKRIALIAAASFVVLAGLAAGSLAYFKPAFIFGQNDEVVAAEHGVPIYSEDASEKAQVRRHTLRLLEELGAVQDKIIRGDRAALAEQQRLLIDIAREVKSFSPEAWDDYVNVRTSLLYVLSGGDARVLQPLIKQNSLSVADQNLAAGIMSFAEGQPKKARDLFEDIDPRSLDVSLVGPFALAKASLYLEDDHATAIRLLDDARLACPHTAIDEASARREIPVLLDAGDTSRALMLTTSYVQEFGKSIYAWKLFREFAEAAAKHGEFDNQESIDRLAATFDDDDMQPASELFIDLAGEGLLQGRLKLAKAAAAKVLATPNASPENKERARLYMAAAEAPSNDAVNAMKALDQITVDRLSEDDAEIREVAGFIAKTVTGTDVAPTAVRKTAPQAVAQAPGEKNAMTALSKADEILKEADSMITRSGK
ncbi:hypothetical protein RLW55_06920 [Hyphomicrobium sp. B1]|jgi:chemotaxis protein MotC|uniref:hypothetical protein n=1 Tax=Hyphomicrobium sp. B1 TaxID=3075651 RepID=UPI003C2C4E0C